MSWHTSEQDKNRQPQPLQKWISVRFEFKHDSNLKLRNAQLQSNWAFFLPNYDRFCKKGFIPIVSKTPSGNIFKWLSRWHVLSLYDFDSDYWLLSERGLLLLFVPSSIMIWNIFFKKTQCNIIFWKQIIRIFPHHHHSSWKMKNEIFIQL